MTLPTEQASRMLRAINQRIDQDIRDRLREALDACPDRAEEPLGDDMDEFASLVGTAVKPRSLRIDVPMEMATAQLAVMTHVRPSRKG